MKLKWKLENTNLMIGIACGFAIGAFIINVAPQAISSLMDSYGFSESQAGMINTVEIAMGAISCTLLSPLLLVRFDHQRLIVAGCVLIILGSLSVLAVSSFTSIALLRAIAGLGTGLVLAAASSGLVHAKDPDKLFAEVAVVITLTMTIVIYALASIKAAWGYSGLMLVFSSFAFACCLPMVKLIPKGKPVEEQSSKPLISILKGAGGLGALSMLMFTVLESGIWNFAERAALSVGLDEEQIAMLLSISMASGLAGAILTIVAGKMFGRELPIIIGCAVMGLCGLFIYNPPATIFLIVSIAIFNLSFFFVIPFIFGGCAESDSEGRMTAIVAGMQATGGAIGPSLAGFTIENYGYAFLGYTCLALAAAAAMLGSAMALQLRRDSKTASFQEISA